MLRAVIVAALAGVSFGSQGAELAPTPQGDTGIASGFPLDRGIARHPKVIFISGFEDGYSGWSRHPKTAEIVKDAAIVHGGSACSQTTATRGKNSGGDIVYRFAEGQEKIHLRFYCRFHKDTCIPHHFVKLRAYRPGFGIGGHAGRAPRGDQAFWTGIEPTQGHTWLFYTYWHKMHSWQTPHGASAGRASAFYGNTFHPENQVPFKMDEWICVEAMMKCNTPNKLDGEKAFWINGKLQGHWRTGEPVGTWIRDKFVTYGRYNKRPGPFEGFNFRSSADVMFREIALQWYVSAKVAQGSNTGRNIVYFDDVVLATDYIGPMVRHRVDPARESPRPEAGAPGAGGKEDAGGAGAPSARQNKQLAAEKEAGRLFQMARRAERMGARDVAKKLYEQIVEKFPGTVSAKNAAERLER